MMPSFLKKKNNFKREIPLSSSPLSWLGRSQVARRDQQSLSDTTAALSSVLIPCVVMNGEGKDFPVKDANSL